MLTENLNPIGYYIQLENGFINLNQCLEKMYLSNGLVQSV